MRVAPIRFQAATVPTSAAARFHPPRCHASGISGSARCGFTNATDHSSTPSAGRFRSKLHNPAATQPVNIRLV